MALSQLKATDLKTDQLQIIYKNTPIPHSLDDMIFVADNVDVNLVNPIHHVSGHLLPSALIYLGELQRSKDKMLSGKPIIKIDELKSRMLKGIETKGEFFLQYQPLFNILSGEITAAEALVRWNHPVYGLLSPIYFIPLAEEMGLIEPLTKLILEEASLQIMKWNDSGICNIRASINISGISFRNPHFADTFLSILDTIEVPIEYIEIEITESTLIGNDGHIKDNLKILQSRGALIAIDDFGTGYSSFRLLKQLPIDILKIDKYFLEGLTSSAHETFIVNAIVTMAHNLGMTAIAEGVETKVQLKFLNECHCDGAQGYFLGRPMGHEDMEQYLRVFGMRKLRAI